MDPLPWWLKGIFQIVNLSLISCTSKHKGLFDERRFNQRSIIVKPSCENISHFLLFDVNSVHTLILRLWWVLLLLLGESLLPAQSHAFNRRMLLILSILITLKLIDDTNFSSGQFAPLLAYVSRCEPTIIEIFWSRCDQI